MKVLGVIPARYKSSRLPGKPLKNICGKPMIYWVYESSKKSNLLDDLIVATDDKRIAECCEKFKMEYIMTSEDHPTGTDRVGEVSQKIKASVYVNIQGDEPFITSEMIDSAIKPFIDNFEKIWVTNLATEIKRFSDLTDPTVPKVVMNKNSEAVFLSRYPIPFPKNPKDIKFFKQVCVYGFRPEALGFFCLQEKGVIEKNEDIELLRFIENGVRVKIVKTEHDSFSVDTPEDLIMASEIMEKKNGI